MTLLQFIMMIGLPCSGKSSYIEKFDYVHTGFVYSTDNYITSIMKGLGLTYQEAFKEYYKTSVNAMDSALKENIQYKSNITWDQTNLSRKSRARKLANIPNNYYKIAVVMPLISKDEFLKRNKNRTNEVGEWTYENMRRMIEFAYDDPNSYLTEGFDEVRFVK